MEFKEFKTEILRRAHETSACQQEYKRAYAAETLEDLIRVIKDNFTWCANHQVIDGPLLESVGNEVLNPFGLFVNCNVPEGGHLLLTGNSSAECYGNSSAVCFGNSSAECYGNSYVIAKNERVVLEMHDNAVARVEPTNTLLVSKTSNITQYE